MMLGRTVLIAVLLLGASSAFPNVGNCELPPSSDKISIHYAYQAYEDQKNLVCGNPPPFHSEDGYPCFAGKTLIFYYGGTQGAHLPWLCGDSIYWDFGDGTARPGIDGNLPHIYAAAGTYVVTLTVAGASGTAVISKTVTIIPAPPSVPISLPVLVTLACILMVAGFIRLRP